MPQTVPVTARQQAILEILRECAREGSSPTLDEICHALGLRSRGSLHKHVRALIQAGLVEAPRGRRRSLRLSAAAAGAGQEDDTLPLLGRIAAGHPIEAVGEQERIAVPRQLRGQGACYVLEVRGDSMVDEGILDGDWVIVESRSHARNGELVVALVDGEAATLKRIEQRPGRVILYPANPAHEAQTYPPERVTLQGVVVGQMRRYD